MRGLATVCLFVAASSALAMGERMEPEEGEVCVRGTWVAGGVECQAFAADDGTLHTVLPRQPDAREGDTACVCGEPAQASICMQGTTLADVRIGAAEDCL